MLKGKFMIKGFILVVGIFLLVGCSGLPYVRKDSGFDVKQARYGVMTICGYTINGKPLPGFEIVANSALEISLIRSMNSASQPKAVSHKDFRSLAAAIFEKTGGAQWSAANIKPFRVNDDIVLGDFRELFKQNEIDALIVVMGPVFITLPPQMYELNNADLGAAFEGLNSKNMGDSNDQEYLQALLITPNGKFAYAGNLQSFSVLRWESLKRARLLDENMRNEMMAAIFKTFIDDSAATK